MLLYISVLLSVASVGNITHSFTGSIGIDLCNAYTSIDNSWFVNKDIVLWWGWRRIPESGCIGCAVNSRNKHSIDVNGALELNEVVVLILVMFCHTASCCCQSYKICHLTI